VLRPELKANDATSGGSPWTDPLTGSLRGEQRTCGSTKLAVEGQPAVAVLPPNSRPPARSSADLFRTSAAGRGAVAGSPQPCGCRPQRQWPRWLRSRSVPDWCGWSWCRHPPGQQPAITGAYRGAVADLPIKTIPFFASKRINTAAASMGTQTEGAQRPRHLTGRDRWRGRGTVVLFTRTLRPIGTPAAMCRASSISIGRWGLPVLTVQ
jgi:hypothetical protein